MTLALSNANKGDLRGISPLVGGSNLALGTTDRSQIEKRARGIGKQKRES